MKILNLGRVLLPFLTILNLYADVSAITDTPVIYRGDIARVTLSATGEAVFPQVVDIAGYPVIGTSNTSHISSVNGHMTTTTSRTYSFKPDKNVTVPSFAIEVDGATESTQKFTIVVNEPQESKVGDEFLVEMKLDKSELMVGESAVLSVVFKQRATSRVDDVRLEEPKLENFWVESLGQGQRQIDGEYITMSMNYLIFPQKSGELSIEPIRAAVGVAKERDMDPFFGSFFGLRDMNYEQIHSNSLNISVKPLPYNLKVYGDFSIKASVDKNSTKAGEPINLTITIDGVGNIDDIPAFEFDDKNLLVYPSSPELKRGIINGEYGGEFKQKFAIVSDSNFTIPAASFSYYNKLTKSSTVITTDPIDIEVIGSLPQPNLPTFDATQNAPLTKAEPIVVEKDVSKVNILYIVIAYILGLVSFYIISRLNFMDIRKEPNIINRIKKAKSDRALFELLLPYATRSEVIDSTLEKLEQNIYQKASHKVEKKPIIIEFLKLKLL